MVMWMEIRDCCELVDWGWWESAVSDHGENLLVEVVSETESEWMWLVILDPASSVMQLPHHKPEDYYFELFFDIIKILLLLFFLKN